MPITDEYAELMPDQIKINRDDRQRRHIEVSDLVHSIRLHGVLNPIIVTRDFVLVAGERRLTACAKLGVPVPVRFLDSLDEIEQQLLELEENVKRNDLPWRDAVSAIGRIHDLYCKANPTWTQERTGDTIGLSQTSIAQYLRVYRDLDSPKIAQATGFAAAYNLLSRLDDRSATDLISRLLESDVPQEEPEQISLLDMETSAEASPASPASSPSAASSPSMPSAPSAMPVLTPASRVPLVIESDFRSWVTTYTGKKFSFIHCDFPYGINVFAGKQMQSSYTQTYDDSEDVFWDLTKTLCGNLNSIMSLSGHIMFWFGMQHYEKLLPFLREHAPSLVVNPIPLIWVKSDNVGIAPDPRRGPRQTYETALLISRGDMPIIKVVSNVFIHPTDKSLHPSTKPEPMLRHFFQMFVDSTTRLLDPTCGSGASLRAADALGASAVFGMDIDPVHVSNAGAELRKAQLLRGNA